MNSVRGFTLVELMVTVSITILLLTLAVPNLSSMAWNNHLRSQTFELVGAINLARSEAIKRRVPVVLCRSTNPAAAVPACGGPANTWTNGYLVFASQTNQTYEAATDTLLRAINIDASNVTIKTNSTSNNNLVYKIDGTTDEAGGTARFVICDQRGGDYGRQVNVSPIGRPIIVSGATGAALNCEAPV